MVTDPQGFSNYKCNLKVVSEHNAQAILFKYHARNSFSV